MLSGSLRICALLVVLIAGPGPSLRAQSPAPRSFPPPNIILILADDLGWGDLSAHGQLRFATPNLDRLAREGASFTQAYAGSPICAPSRYSLLVGRHSGRATIRGNYIGGAEHGARAHLLPHDVTVAERLRAAGYATALIGKWGLGEPESPSPPWARGFDFFYGYVNQRHAHSHFPEFLYRQNTPEPLSANFGHAAGTFSGDRITAEALAWIAQPRDRPFFLLLAYTSPHAEMRAPDDALAAVRAEHAWARDPATPPARAAFAALMRCLDRDVGRLLDALRAHDRERDTVVLFTSDNGPHAEDGHDPAFFRSSGPFRGLKRDLHEGGLRVPFFARWPGRIAPARTDDHLLGFWDVPATLLEIAGVPRPADLPAESLSFAPALLGRSADQAAHDHLYWEVVVSGQARQAVRSGPWKAVRYGLCQPVQLYHLADDPGETRDLAAREPALAGRLAALFETSRVESPWFPLAPPPRRAP